MMHAVLRAPGMTTMTATTAVLSGGNVLSPAPQLLFNCGAGNDPAGGGDFRLHYREGGTLNYVTDALLAVDQTYNGTANTPLTVAAPGLLKIRWISMARRYVRS